MPRGKELRGIIDKEDAKEDKEGEKKGEDDDGMKGEDKEWEGEGSEEILSIAESIQLGF
ncbi:hypothetical protein H2199_009058 [Coniosporium tulheliwenetii]|uniref:Uncharacterized protein n=1 Tax=Coniosporium tulheliwenetii TaxID=3383036 RepID=A0ACC2YGH7_9PEZI|nr:hypothetical protein H2199_009058 [Cladosporium sp. JES 115]